MANPEKLRQSSRYTTAEPTAITSFLVAVSTHNKVPERIALREKFLQDNIDAIIEVDGQDDTKEQFLLIKVNEDADNAEDSDPSSPRYWEQTMGIELVADDYFKNSAVTKLADLADAEDGSQVVGVALQDIWQIGNAMHEARTHSPQETARMAAAMAVYGHWTQH